MPSLVPIDFEPEFAPPDTAGPEPSAGTRMTPVDFEPEFEDAPGSGGPEPSANIRMTPVDVELEPVDGDPFAEIPQEDSLGSVISKSAKAGAERFGAQVGGMRQRAGESLFQSTLELNPELAGQLTRQVQLTIEEIAKLPKGDGMELPSPETLSKARAEKARKAIQGIQAELPEVKAGREQYQQHAEAAAAARPKVEDGSFKYYLGAATETMIGNVAPMMATALITRSPNMALGLMGGQVYGEKYAEQREKGRTEDEANIDALFYAASEAITEKIPLSIVLKRGTPFLKKVLQGTVAEGAQEVFNEALQMGYEAQVLDEKVDLKTALRRLLDAGIIGGMLGGGMGAVAAPFTNGKDNAKQDDTPTPETNSTQADNVDEIDLLNPQPTVAEVRKTYPPEGREKVESSEIETKPAATLTPVDGNPFAKKKPAQIKAEFEAEFPTMTDEAKSQWWAQHAKSLRARYPRAYRSGKKQIQALSKAPVDKPMTRTPLSQAVHEAATSPKNDLPQPTEKQKQAGNYKKAHVKLNGLDISIENPEGSQRTGVDRGGKKWSVKMKHSYGYLKGTVGKDKDHLDVSLGPDAENPKRPVFVVDQVDPKTGRFDEHKIQLGFKDEAAARAGYLANYEKGWKGLGAIKQFTPDEFKTWLEGDTTKPVALKPKRAPGKKPVMQAGKKAPGRKTETALPASGASSRSAFKPGESCTCRSKPAVICRCSALERKSHHPERFVQDNRSYRWSDTHSSMIR